MKNRVRRLVLAAGTLAVVTAPVLAGTEPAPIEITGITNVINMTTFAALLIAAAGTVLAVSFGIGASFRIAKKGYRWMVGKI